VASTPCDEADLANASLAQLTIHVNLGQLDAKATYKPVTAS